MPKHIDCLAALDDSDKTACSGADQKPNHKLDKKWDDEPFALTRTPAQLNSPQTSHTSTRAVKQFNLYVTIDTQLVTALRRMVMHSFSNIVSSISIQPVSHARKMKVCLRFSKAVEDSLMTTIMRTLPSAEFGRITLAG